MKNQRFYQEVRGVMTRFEPLTEQALEAAGKQAFTLPELHQSLREHGLDPRHVVHDPGRTVFSTYYADYDKGLYSDILLQRSSLEERAPLKPAHILGGLAVAASVILAILLERTWF